MGGSGPLCEVHKSALQQRGSKMEIGVVLVQIVLVLNTENLDLLWIDLNLLHLHSFKAIILLSQNIASIIQNMNEML